MAYKRADSKNFAEYQLGEGFGSAVTGKAQTPGNLGGTASPRMPAGFNGLAGYEGYADYLQDMEQNLTSGSKPTSREVAKLAQNNAYSLPEPQMAGAEGMFGSIEEDAFAGFDGVEDDAFAGYIGDNGITSISNTAVSSAMAIDADEEAGDEPFDGYGGLGDTPLESFHTYFHQAAKANTETGVIKKLAKAVSVVPDDTPMSVRRNYYDLAMEMLKRRKETNMRYLDLQLAEINSNIGWLINPSLPKTGGFDAMLDKAVGKVGGKLAANTKEALQEQHNRKLGKLLLKEANPWEKGNIIKDRQAAFGDFSGGGMSKYLGFAAAGLALVGIIYWYRNKQAATAARSKRKRSRRKRK